MREGEQCRKSVKGTYLRVHLFILLRRIEELLRASAPAAGIMGHRFRTGTPALSNFLPSKLPIFLEFSMFRHEKDDHEPARSRNLEGSSIGMFVIIIIIIIKAGTVSRTRRERRERNFVIERVELITSRWRIDAAINPFLAPTFRFKRSYENAEPYLTRPLPPPTQGWEPVLSSCQTFRSAH